MTMSEAKEAAAQTARTATAEVVGEAVDKYISGHGVDVAVQDILQSLLEARPDDPRTWLLTRLEQELSDESEDLSESDLHKLFAVTRRITSEIMPRDTIDMVISETMELLYCDIVSLFVLDKKINMLRLYASNLDTPITVRLGQGIAGSVFDSKETVNIADCYQDRRFDQSFDRKSGYLTRSLIAVPIVDYDGCSVGVIQAINKLPRLVDGSTPVLTPEEAAKPAGTRAQPFRRTDEKILLHLAGHVCIAMRNAEVYREAIASSERATGLLNTVQSLSQDLGVQSLLLTITMHANKIVSAQRSTVFLMDEQNAQLWSVSTDTGQEIRIPKHAGIAGQCCRDGTIINIPDAYADSRFNQEIDKRTGFKTHSILAIPMFDQSTSSSGEHFTDGAGESHVTVVGVIQMINKVAYDGQLDTFDETDVDVMELFAKFVGPSLCNSSMLHRRQSNLEQSEGEMALGSHTGTHDPKNVGTHGDHGPSTRKRGSIPLACLDALGEEGEEAAEKE